MSDEPARFLVQEFFRITGRGTIASGVLSAGSVRVGEVLRVESTGGPVRVRSIELHGVVPVPGGERHGLVLADESVSQVAVGDVLVGEPAPVGTVEEIAALPGPGTDPRRDGRDRRHALYALRAGQLGVARIDLDGYRRDRRRVWLDEDVAAAEADLAEAGDDLELRAATRLLERARRRRAAEQQEVQLEELVDGWVDLAGTWRRERASLPAASSARAELADREAALLGLLGLPWTELLVRLRIGDLPGAGEGPDPWALREDQLSGRSGRVVVPGTEYRWTAPHLQGPDGRATVAFAGTALRGGQAGGWRPVPAVWQALVDEDRRLPDAELGWAGSAEHPVLVHRSDRWPDWRATVPEVPLMRGQRWRPLDPGETAEREHRWPAPAHGPDPLGAPCGLADPVPRPVRPLGGSGGRGGREGPVPVLDVLAGAAVLPDGDYAEWAGRLHVGSTDWKAAKQGRAPTVDLLTAAPLTARSVLRWTSGWSTPVPAGEVAWWSLRTRCRWGPNELAPTYVHGDQLGAYWLGGDSRRAETRGMSMVDRGSYAGTVPLGEVTHLHQERTRRPG